MKISRNFKKLVLGLVVIFGVFLFLVKNNEPVIYRLVSEELMSYSKFTISPNDEWIVYSSGSFEKENLIAFNTKDKNKYNLTQDSSIGSLLSSSFTISCWSLDSKYCSFSEYYIDFSQKEPKLVKYSNDKKSRDIQNKPRSCSDCKNDIQYEDGVRILSPDNKWIAYTKDKIWFSLFLNRNIYIKNTENNTKIIIKNIGASNSDFHWSSDSKRLYFYYNNGISYIDVL